MLSESEVYKLYYELENFLISQDAKGIEDYDVYEKAVEKYELLHKILEIPYPPHWCS